MDIKNVYDAVIFASAALTLKDALIEAISRKADLRGANLREANLCGADLREADLYGANLRGANLYEADLREAKNADLAIARLQFIPTEGAFIAWKKCRENVIVKLSVPEDAKRSHSTGRKCRASKALVLDVFGAEFGISLNTVSVEYRKGCLVIPDSFDDNRWEECSHGIHFFITREEAEAYEN